VVKHLGHRFPFGKELKSGVTIANFFKIFFVRKTFWGGASSLDCGVVRARG
jgi:hypothetical protein